MQAQYLVAIPTASAGLQELKSSSSSSPWTMKNLNHGIGAVNGGL